MKITLIFNLILVFLLMPLFLFAQGRPKKIQTYKENPHYLAWGDTPVFLIGATGYHSWTPISRPGTSTIEAQLEKMGKMVAAINSPHVMGMVRWLPYDPMNHLHDGPVKEVLQPWLRKEDGRFDLSGFSVIWEERLKKLLDLSLNKKIIVVLEVWDDWSVTRGPGGAYDPGENFGWNGHPLNPKNNINFDEAALSSTTSACSAPFYQTLPAKDNNLTVFEFQKQYVDHLLEIVKDYPHVLLNVNNESRADLTWTRFWAEYIGQKFLMIGDMPSTNRKDGGGECQQEFNPMTLALDPIYAFVDVSQGVSGHEFSSPKAQAIDGGKRLRDYREAMINNGQIKPLVVSKDYTRDENGGDIVIWSRFINGTASTRFHRPAGDSPESVITYQHQAMLRLGKFISKLDFWKMAPNPDGIAKLPEGMSANVLSNPEVEHVLQLLNTKENNQVQVNITPGNWGITWIDPSTGMVLSETTTELLKKDMVLSIPYERPHLVLLLKKIKS